MDKKKINKILSWILVIVWMIIIFKFSHDPAQISNNKSGFVIRILQNMGIDLNSSLGKWTNFIVRKSGHLIEYFILYILLFNAIKKDFSYKKTLKISLSIVFLYACSDEFHQLFIPGRSGQFKDVLIDTFGGCIALFIIDLTGKLKKLK